MKLKSLELAGFKSFADRTRIEFSKGITAIVGPNGAGKSNIVDAIRWVMGETAPSFIRTKLLEDVIFSGSEASPPTGMAEVTITFDNTEGMSPVGYESYGEIQVSRKAYRDGESEFFINKTPCRLKDIVEIFLDTGSGSRGYCIIEQAKVQKIISAKAEEKRFLIEEAAGVAKYRLRKKEALRKLESTRQNLARVSDILLEVKRQLGSIDRQARKAKRYKKLRERFKDLELEYLRRKADRDAERERIIQNDIDRVMSLIEKGEEKIEFLRSKEEQIQNSIFSIETEVEDVRERLSRANESFFRLDARLEGMNKEMWDIEERGELLRGEMAARKGELLSMEEKSSEISRELSSQDEELSLFLDVPSEGKEEFSERKVYLEGMKEECEERREELLDLLSETKSHEDSITIHEKWIGETERKIAYIEKECTTVSGELSTLEEKSAGNLAREKEISLQIDLLEEEIQSERQVMTSLTRDISRLDENVLSMQKEREQVRSRCIALTQILERYEMYGPPVSFIMKEFGEKGEKLKVLGVLGSLIDVEQGYERAVEAALGDSLKYIIVQSTEDGMVALRELKQKGRGRAFFAPMKVRKKAGKSVAVPAGEGVISPVAGIISAPEECRELIEDLLFDVVLVNSLDDALRLWKINGTWATYVTLEGDVVFPSGVISGGSSRNEEKGILLKKRELSEFENRLMGIEKNLENQKYLLEKCKRERMEGAGNIEKKSEKLAEMEREKYSIRVNLEYGEKETEKQRTRQKWAEGELSHLKAEQMRFVEQNKEVKEKIAEGRGKSESLQKEIERLREEIFRLEEDLKVREAEVGRRSILKVELQEKSGRLRAEIESLGQLIMDRKGTIEKGTGELGELLEKRKRIEREKEITLSTLTKLDGDRKGLEKEMEGRVAQLSSQKEGLEKNLAERSQCARDIEGVREEMVRYRESRAEVKTRLEGIIEVARDSYGVEDIRSRCKEEELISLPDEEVGREIEKTRRQIESIGEVNMDSIEERDDLARRFEDLTHHKDDLEKSMKDIIKVISKIDRVTKERFANMFGLVNEKFQDLFPKLFMGGRGNLVLTEPDDPLLSGVEIVPQPPGKKLTNLSLLSNGEKALTGISLLLSLFFVRTGPFLFLDEVDAPLDEANVDRFNRLVREISDTCQIILVTHKKRSMELADFLYGVTMDRPGMSRIVSAQIT